LKIYDDNSYSIGHATVARNGNIGIALAFVVAEQKVKRAH
jgi:hypothetical protein